MSRRLMFSSVLSPKARNRIFLRINRHSCAAFSSGQDDTASITVRSSLRGEESWQRAAKASEQFLETTLDPRVLETKLPELLLECIHSESTDSGPLAGRLLERADKDGQLTAELMHMTIEAWLKSKHDNGLDEAERILWRMLTEAEIHNTSRPEKVDRINGAFALVVSGLSRDEQVARADKLVDRVQQLYDDDNISLQPNTTALNGMLSLWAKEGKLNSVLNLLHHMLKEQDNGRNKIAPNNVSFNCAVNAYAKQGDPQGATKIVQLMLERYKQNRITHPLDVVTFNCLLDVWRNSGHPSAGERAKEVLQWMEREQVQPDTRSYNCVIDAYAKSNAPLEAEAILRHLLRMKEEGINVGPDEFSFTAVVHAWATSNEASTKAAERASAVIELMENLQDSGYEGITPSVSPYNALIGAWATSNDEGRVQKVKTLLVRMKRHGIVPNARTYSSIISALVKCGDSGVDEALKFLYDLEDARDAGDTSVALDTACYNAVLSGLIRSKRRDAVDVAEQLRQRMVQREKATGECNIGPNTVTYNAIMGILSNARLKDSAARVERLLNEMEAGGQQVKPSAVSYITCISAWAKSNDRHKIERAQAILERMKEAHASGNKDAKPTLIAYNALLNGCSFPVGSATERAHAVSIVLETLKELQASNFLNPDHITYATAMKAFGRCIPSGTRRDELVETEFENCCRDGQVNDFVLRELQQASFGVYAKHVGNEDPTGVITKIPLEWRRNVSSRGMARNQ